MQYSRRSWCVFAQRSLWASLLLLVGPSLAVGDFPQTPALLDNMDGPTPILKPLVGAVGMEVLHHAVDRQLYRFGTGAERIRLVAPAGNSAQLAYRLPNTPVIGELRVAAWVLCNRPGMQLAATVVLPRSKNSSTGRPYELLVRGTLLGKGVDWEQLTLEDLPKSVERLARVARAQHGSQLDERGAYVSQVLVLAPGGTAGATECVVDRIEIYGMAGSKAGRASPRQAPRVRPTHKTLQIPQIIQWQGEPFEFLAKLGFDAVGMKRLPSAAELEEAGRLGLALLCPPPTPRQITEQGMFDELSSVFAWDLGDQLSSGDLDHLIRWQQLIKRFDPVESRPTFITPRLFTREASRLADVLLIGRTMLGTEISLQDHTTWLTQRRRLARPGTDIWTRIETQLSPSQALQASALQLGPDLSAGASYLQLTALTSAAFAVKSRGFYFLSHSSLAAADPATQRRAKALQLNNLRLKLAEPWLASGKVFDVARCSQPELSALVLKAERSHLLVPMRWSRSMLTLRANHQTQPLSFTVPGVGESSEAYLLTLGGTERLRSRRVTGGVRVSLESLPEDALVLLTDDPQAFSQVTRYLRKIAPEATRLRRELAALRLQESTTFLAKLGHQTSAKNQVDRWLQQAKNELQACDQYLATGSFDLAYLRAGAVDHALDLIEQSEVAQGPSRYANRLLARTPVGANLLTGGGFENLPAMLQAGWRHHQLPLEGVTTAVRLSSQLPHSGSYCLELEAGPSEGAAPVPVVPASPVWITSAPVRIQAGDLVEITGVVRVPKPLLGTVDGLQLIDSLGGPDMALRIPQSSSWQPFRILRVAPNASEVTVSIALTGLGKAQIDDLAIRTTRIQSQKR